MNAASEDLPGREGASKEADTHSSKAVRSSQPVNAENSGFLRGAISIFILFNMIASLSWAVPLKVAPLPQLVTSNVSFGRDRLLLLS